MESNLKRTLSLVNVNVDLSTKIPAKYLKQIKSLIKETLYNSTAQAIIKIIETPIFTLKIFLFLCVIFSSGVCSYLIVQLILSYLSYGVSTTTRTLYEAPALFPKITICNTIPFTTPNAMEFIKQINKEVNSTIDIFNDEQMSKLDSTWKYKLVNLIFNTAMYKMNELNETEKRKLSHSLEEILLSCEFNLQYCLPIDFSWHFDPVFGNCWTFNSGHNGLPLATSNLPGELNGLKMELYVNFYQNLTKVNANVGRLGALVRIENSSYSTNYIGSDGIRITPGQATSLALSRSFRSILPRPYSNCLIDNETNSGYH
jgi:hypothetical protein